MKKNDFWDLKNHDAVQHGGVQNVQIFAAQHVNNIVARAEALHWAKGELLEAGFRRNIARCRPNAGPMPAMLKRSDSSRSSVQLNQLRNCARCALFGQWGNTMQRSQMWPGVCFALLTSSGRFDRLPFPAPICLSRQCPLILQALQQGTCLWFYSSVFQF